MFINSIMHSLFCNDTWCEEGKGEGRRNGDVIPYPTEKDLV